MPSGNPASSSVRSLVQRPSRCTIAPDSARWRSTSPTKNGLPWVSCCTACASPTAGSSRSWPATVSMSANTSDWSRPTRSSRRHARLAAEVGEHLGERVGAVEIRVAVGREHEEAHRRRRRATRGGAATTTACRPSARRRARGSPVRPATSRPGSHPPLRTAGGARSRDRPLREQPARARAPRDRASMRVSSPPSGPSSARSRSTGTHAE